MCELAMAKQRQEVKGTKTQKTPKELKAWEKERELIPVMIKKYCHGNHGTRGEELCEPEPAERGKFRGVIASGQ